MYIVCSFKRTKSLIGSVNRINAFTLQFHGSVLQPDMLTFLLTFLRPEMKFKNISPHGEIFLFSPKTP